MRGWEIGGQPEHLDEDDVLLNVDQERTCESLEGSDLEDEHGEVWKNWQVDDREPDSWDEWTDDGGQVTTHALSLFTVKKQRSLMMRTKLPTKTQDFRTILKANRTSLRKTEEYVAV